MKRFNYLLGLGLTATMGLPALADEANSGGAEPELSARGQALLEIEYDREAVISALSAAAPQRDAESVVGELQQLENHELIDRMVGEATQASRSGPAVELLSFGTSGDNADMVFTALDAPCRLLDTRAYTVGGSNPIPANIAREVWDFSIFSQGGDTTCTSPLLGKSALVVALTAISPTFPNKFPGVGYATLLNGSEMLSGWSPTSSIPTGQFQYTFNTPPYTEAVSVVWDTDTTFIETLAVVTRSPSSPEIVLFSASTAHYTIDAVGYFEDPELCASGKTFIDGMCWGAVEAAGTWFAANQNCSAQGGQLPTAAAVNGAMQAGDLANQTIWAAGWYHDGTTYRGQSTSSGLTITTTNVATAYRCVFTPLTHP